MNGGEYDRKSWVIAASYTPMKNTNIAMAYFHGKSRGSDRSAKTFYTRGQMFWQGLGRKQKEDTERPGFPRRRPGLSHPRTITFP